MSQHTDLNCSLHALTVAKHLFDVWQKSINVHPHTLAHHGPYCNSFNDLEERIKQAWIDTAKSVIPVQGL